MQQLVDVVYFVRERSGGNPARGSENKLPFVAAVQPTSDGQPQFVGLRLITNQVHG